MFAFHPKTIEKFAFHPQTIENVLFMSLNFKKDFFFYP